MEGFIIDGKQHFYYSNNLYINRLMAYSLFILLVFFCGYEYTVRVMLGAIAPILLTDLNLTPQAFGVLSSVYFYAYAPVQLFSGYLHARYGVARVTFLAVFLCTLGIFLFSYNQHYPVLIFSRFLMGFASGFAFVGAYILVSQIFSYKYWGLMYGLIQFLSAGSAMLGQNVIAHLAQLKPWRELVLELAIIGSVLFLLLGMFFKERRKVVTATNFPNNLKKSLFALFKNKQALLIAFYSLLTWGPITIYTTLWGPLFLTSHYGWTNALSVSVISITWVGVAIGSPFFGWLTHFLGNRRSPMFLAAMIGLITSPILIFAHINNYLIQCLLAFCIGLSASGQPVAFVAIQESTRKQHASTAIGINNFAIIIGGGVFQALSSFLLKRTSQTVNLVDATALLTQLQNSFILIILCYLFSAFIVLFFIQQTSLFAKSGVDNTSFEKSTIERRTL